MENIVTGVSLNSDLYTGNQEKKDEDSSDDLSNGQLNEIREQIASDEISDKNDRYKQADIFIQKTQMEMENGGKSTVGDSVEKAETEE